MAIQNSKIFALSQPLAKGINFSGGNRARNGGGGRGGSIRFSPMHRKTSFQINQFQQYFSRRPPCTSIMLRLKECNVWEKDIYLCNHFFWCFTLYSVIHYKGCVNSICCFLFVLFLSPVNRKAKEGRVMCFEQDFFLNWSNKPDNKSKTVGDKHLKQKSGPSF